MPNAEPALGDRRPASLAPDACRPGLIFWPGLILVGPFEAVVPTNGIGSVEPFQTLPHPPAQTFEVLVSVAIRSLSDIDMRSSSQMRTDRDA